MLNISQEAIKHKHTVINNLDEEILLDPKYAFNKLNNSDLEVINIICCLCAKHKTTYVSQSTIAKWTKLTRRQINRIMKKICGLGIIHKVFREYNTSIYFIHNFFRDIKIKRVLEEFIPNIRLLAFEVKKLFSIATTPIHRVIKPINKMLHYYSPFFRDDKVEEAVEPPPPRRGFNSLEYIEACLNIGVKNQQ